MQDIEIIGGKSNFLYCRLSLLKPLQKEALPQHMLPQMAVQGYDMRFHSGTE
jgi:hypothetical protein